MVGTEESEIHFGHLIKKLLREEGRSISWFAERMHSDRSNMYKMLERSHVDTQFILKASIVLKHNFFNDASLWYINHKSVKD